MMECDPPAESSADKKRSVQILIERYYHQLTRGCGRSVCDNPRCASSGQLQALSPNEAAALSIQCLTVRTFYYCVNTTIFYY